MRFVFFLLPCVLTFVGCKSTSESLLDYQKRYADGLTKSMGVSQRAYFVPKKVIASGIGDLRAGNDLDSSCRPPRGAVQTNYNVMLPSEWKENALDLNLFMLLDELVPGLDMKLGLKRIKSTSNIYTDTRAEFLNVENSEKMLAESACYERLVKRGTNVTGVIRGVVYGRMEFGTTNRITPGLQLNWFGQNLLGVVDTNTGAYYFKQTNVAPLFYICSDVSFLVPRSPRITVSTNQTSRAAYCELFHMDNDKQQRMFAFAVMTNGFNETFDAPITCLKLSGLPKCKVTITEVGVPAAKKDSATITITRPGGDLAISSFSRDRVESYYKLKHNHGGDNKWNATRVQVKVMPL